MRLRVAFCLLCLLVSQGALAGVLERVEETKTFRIGYREDTPPFSSEPQPGTRVGYSLDLCRAVADALRYELNLEALVVQYVPVLADNRFNKIENGEIDILCGPTTVTLSRRARVDFSLPTFVDGAGVMVRNAEGIGQLADLAALRLAVNGGTTTEEALRASFPDADITTVSDHTAGVAGLLARSFDAYFADRTVLHFLRLSQPEAEELFIAEEYLTVEPFALAMPLGDTRFRLLVDRTLSALYITGQIKEIAAEAFGSAQLSRLVRALYQITPLPE